MTLKRYATISGIIFLLVAFLYLIRVVAEWNLIIGGSNIPSWVSMLIVAVLGYLSYTGFRIAIRFTQTD